jgi:hypothetical protein
MNIMQYQNTTLNHLSNLPSESPAYIIIQGVRWHKKKKKEKLSLFQAAVQETSLTYWNMSIKNNARVHMLYS